MEGSDPFGLNGSTPMHLTYRLYKRLWAPMVRVARTKPFGRGHKTTFNMNGSGLRWHRKQRHTVYMNDSRLQWRPLEGEQGHTYYYKPFQAPMARATGAKPFGARMPDFRSSLFSFKSRRKLVPTSYLKAIVKTYRKRVVGDYFWPFVGWGLWSHNL